MRDKQKESLKNTDMLPPELIPNIENYWERVFSASVRVTEHIFNTHPNRYPLLYQKILMSNNDSEKVVGEIDIGTSSTKTASKRY